MDFEERIMLLLVDITVAEAEMHLFAQANGFESHYDLNPAKNLEPHKSQLGG